MGESKRPRSAPSHVPISGHVEWDNGLRGAPRLTRMDLIQRTVAWIDGDPDPVTRAELQSLLDSGDTAALEERMGPMLRFGTAGIRGVVEAGSSRMNRAVIIKTTAGLGAYLLRRHGSNPGPVVVGFDARLSSRQFAEDTTGVLLAAGFEVFMFPEPTPTPIVAFAGKELQAIATVVVTASHNPPRDNGYKVYDDNGAQIIPPVDEGIASEIELTGPARSVPRAEIGRATILDDRLFEQYWCAVDAERPKVEPAPLRIVTTPLHGVGGRPLVEILSKAGYTDIFPVPEQFEPDGRFPTTVFPNPEEPGALDLALELASNIEADLVIANDPDADRLAVAVPGTPDWQTLSGNQVGVLLADHILTHWHHSVRPIVINSIVSTPMLGAVARYHDAHFEQTLTGFKWITNAALDLEARGVGRFALGFEEALGYSVGPVVRDKDGLSAALVFTDMVAEAQRTGRNVDDLLDDLALRCGTWVSAQHAVVRPGSDGLDDIQAAMERLGNEQPSVVAGRDVVSVTDFRKDSHSRPRWLPADGLMLMELAGDGRVLVRPSGTEPKLKIYVDLRAALGGADSRTAEEARLVEEARGIGAAMAGWLDL